MLTPEDIALIKSTRMEITQNRTVPVVFWYEGQGAEDPFTGESESEVLSLELDAVVTEISSAANTAIERLFDNGVELLRGDLLVDVPIDGILDAYKTVDYVDHDGEPYTVLARDKKGLGEVNRAIFLGRRRA